MSNSRVVHDSAAIDSKELPQKCQNAQELRDLFDSFDADGTGFISKGEFKAFYMSTGVDVDEAELDAWLKDCWEGGDDHLSFNDFECLMLKSPGESAAEVTRRSSMNAIQKILYHCEVEFLEGIKPTEVSSELFTKVKEVAYHRKQMQKLWAEKGCKELEEIPSFNALDTENMTLGGQYKPEMRQQNMQGEPIEHWEEVVAVADAGILTIFKELVEGLLSDLTMPQGYAFWGCNEKHIPFPSPILKSKIRALKKAFEDYADRKPGPALSWVFDIVRGSILVDEARDILQLVNALRAKEKQGAIQIVRLKNLFQKPNHSGFMNINMNVRIRCAQVWHMVEMQLNLREIKQYTEDNRFHDTYEYFRAFFAGDMEGVVARMKLLDEFISQLDVSGEFSDIVAAVISQKTLPLMKSLKDICTMVNDLDLAVAVQTAIVLNSSSSTLLNYPMAELRQLGTDLLKAGHFDLSISLLQHVLNHERVLDPDSADTAATLHLLEKVYMVNCNITEGIGVLDRAVALRESLQYCGMPSKGDLQTCIPCLILYRSGHARTKALQPFTRSYKQPTSPHEKEAPLTWFFSLSNTVSEGSINTAWLDYMANLRQKHGP